MISNRLADLPVPVQRDGRGWRLVLDLAVLGHSEAPDPSGRIGPRDSQNYFAIDVRGDSFFVAGLLYPGGTIPTPTVPTPISVFPNAPPKINNQTVWEFTGAKPIGHHVNRGWVLIHGGAEGVDTRGTPVDPPRTVPHLLSTHTFVLGDFAPDNLSPPMLVASGVENGNDPDDEVVIRSITGGTGPFRFARGEVRQDRIGRNSTRLRSFSRLGDVLSPNYRFTFTLTGIEE